jgi:hypothetical protein
MTTTPNLFGIGGLTIGGLGVWGLWLTTVGALAVWWIRGIPERRRAATEGVSVLFANMSAELARMEAKIERLEQRVDTLVAERDAALAKAAKLEAINDGQGEINTRVARLVAADRLEVAAELKTGKAGK